MLLPIYMLTLTFNIQPAKADPATFMVPDDYPTIQEAIDAASPGCLILVSHGTYRGNLIITKSIKLVGEEPHTTVLDGQRTSNVIEVTADDVQISGFTIQNSSSDNLVTKKMGAGIFLSRSSDVTIRDNIISDNGWGIRLERSGNNSISNNKIANNSIGLRIQWSDNNIIVDNLIVNNILEHGGIRCCGLWLTSSYGNTLKGNNLTGNRYNFAVGGNILTHYINDVDTSNTVDGKPIYYLVNQRNQQVPTEAGYVAVVSSTNITVRNLELINNYDGVLFAYSTHSIVENVNIHENWVGVRLTYASSNVIDSNTMMNNAFGISLSNSHDNFIMFNNVSNVYWGWGVYLHSSTQNTINCNSFLRNGRGVELYKSEDNTLCYNNFIENRDQVILYSSSNNRWDDQENEGNYWSDYAGRDVNNDTVGDTKTPHLGLDYHPLLLPFQHHFPMLKLEVYIYNVDLSKLHATIDAAIWIKAPSIFDIPSVTITGDGLAMVQCDSSRETMYSGRTKFVTWFLGGMGEMYPFDCYEMNFTVLNPLPSTRFGTDFNFLRYYSRACFQGSNIQSLMDTWETTDQLGELPIAEYTSTGFTVKLERKWQLPTLQILVPILASYSFLGASLFLKKVDHKLRVYLSIFAFSAGFLFIIQTLLPYRSTYSIPEFLLTNLVTNLTIIGSFTMIGSVFATRISVFLEGAAMIVSSVMFAVLYHFLFSGRIALLPSIILLISQVLVLVVGVAGLWLRFSRT